MGVEQVAQQSVEITEDSRWRDGADQVWQVTSAPDSSDPYVGIHRVVDDTVRGMDDEEEDDQDNYLVIPVAKFLDDYSAI